MTRLPLLAAVLALGACSAKTGQVSAAAVTGYTAAVAAEVVFLDSGKATPAQAVCLRSYRLKADAGVKQVEAADAAGGATAAMVSAAQSAVDALKDAATNQKGC